MKIKFSFFIQVLAFLVFKCIYTITYQEINGGSFSKFREYYNLTEFIGDLFVAIFVTYFMSKFIKSADESKA